MRKGTESSRHAGNRVIEATLTLGVLAAGEKQGAASDGDEELRTLPSTARPWPASLHIASHAHMKVPSRGELLLYK